MFVIYITDVLGRRLVLSRFQWRGSFCQAADSWASCLEPNVPAGDLLLADIAESSVAAAIPEDLPNLPPVAEPCSRISDAGPARRAHGQAAGRGPVSRRQRARGLADYLPASVDPLRDIPYFVEKALDLDAAAIDAHVPCWCSRCRVRRPGIS